MKSLFYLLAGIVVLTACSGVVPEWQAASAARDYYECLADGDAEGFLRGKAGADTLPAAYREQLLAAVRQYQSDMERKHRGLRGVRIADDHYNQSASCRDTSLHVVYAFLLLAYADSTQEEVTVPMVEYDGRWMMK